MTEERRQELEALLKKIETAIGDLVEKKISSYRLGERTFTFYSIGELRQMRNEIIAELNGGVKTYIATPSGEY